MRFPSDWQEIVNSVVYSARPGPNGGMQHWGFHDDHRSRDRMPEYRPALQQVKAEYMELLRVLDVAELADGRALQLGKGMTDHSHYILDRLFAGAVTIDFNGCIASARDQPTDLRDGAGTQADSALGFAAQYGPYSFILVDAGHSFDEVAADHRNYWSMLRPGGIMAFHDALDREGFPEIGVPKFVRELKDDINMIGTEVGFAWIRKPV